METARPEIEPAFHGVRAVIVDDQKLVAEALRSVLMVAGIAVVEVVPAKAEDSHSLVMEARPELIILDLGRLGSEGIDWSKRVLADLPDVKILALLAGERPLLAQAAIRSGIHGCLSKNSAMPDLLNAIRGVLAGQAVLSVPIARKMNGNGNGNGDAYVRLLADQLTQREHDVLALLVDGASSQEMVRELRVSRNTVRTHIQNILTKLQVHSRLEAAAFAVRHGIVRTE